MYSKSRFTQSSKLLMRLRPLTCQKQVRPGCAVSLRLCHSSYRSSSCGQAGLGPTRLISPFKTLQSCGSSLRLYFRRNLPKGVTRGSLAILNSPSFASLRSRTKTHANQTSRRAKTTRAALATETHRLRVRYRPPHSSRRLPPCSLRVSPLGCAHLDAYSLSRCRDLVIVRTTARRPPLRIRPAPDTDTAGSTVEPAGR